MWVFFFILLKWWITLMNPVIPTLLSMIGILWVILVTCIHYILLPWKKGTLEKYAKYYKIIWNLDIYRLFVCLVFCFFIIFSFCFLVRNSSFRYVPNKGKQRHNNVTFKTPSWKWGMIIFGWNSCQSS